MAIISVSVIIFQIVIFFTIVQSAEKGGRGGLNVATALWVIFTIFGSIFTMGLLLLQLGTIVFAYNVGTQALVASGHSAPETPMELQARIHAEAIAQKRALIAAQMERDRSRARLYFHAKYTVPMALLVVLVAGSKYGWPPRSDTWELEAWVAEVKARPPPPLDPLPVLKQFENFEYSAEGLRDPYALPLSARVSGSGLRPDPDRRKEVLEAYPLDGLSMVGTIGRSSDLIGLVLAPDRVTYRVRPGNYLGESDGRITAVYADRIEMVELVPDGAGGWLERQAEIALEDN